VIAYLLYRTAKILVLSAGVLPGLILFAPIFIVGKLISIQKAREALAASTVKIQARDVMATWKLLIAMALAPILYTFYNILLAYWTHYNRVQGYVPDWVPLWAIFVTGYIIFPAVTFAALRFGEIGMDIFKSLRPLAMSLLPGNRMVKLRKKRAALAAEVTDLINTLGPEVFPDFERARIVASDETEEAAKIDQISKKEHYRLADSEPGSPGGPNAGASIGGQTSMQGQLPRNESFKNLSNIPFFASRPATPKRDRSRSNSGGGFKLQGFSTLDSVGSFDEVRKRIGEEMRKRGRRRRSQGGDGQGQDEWETGSEGRPVTPGSDWGDKKDA
ncbi:hypothetical protein LTS18_000802, partial [Coniosporium uncinatum]